MNSNTVAAELHKNALVINALDCTAEENFTAAYVDVLQAGGVNAINLTIPSNEDDFQRAIEQYARWRRRLFQIETEYSS